MVLGPRQAFKTGLYTVRNLYQRTHTVSCMANVGEASYPALPRIEGYAGRNFTLRVAVLESGADGVEVPYDLTGMSLIALVKKYSGYGEAEVAAVPLDVEMEVPARQGLLKVPVVSTDFPSVGSYSVEVVDVLAEEIPPEDPEDDPIPPVYATVCRFEMELKRT